MMGENRGFYNVMGKDFSHGAHYAFDVATKILEGYPEMKHVMELLSKEKELAIDVYYTHVKNDLEGRKQ